MLSEKRYVNKEYDTIGPGRLFLLTGTGEDELLELASIQEATKSVDRVKIQQMETHDGVDVPIRTFQRSENYQVAIKFAEQLSPDLQQFLLGVSPTLDPATVTESVELLRFNGTDPRQVAHPYGIVSSGPPPTGLSAVQFGSGGTIAAGSYAISVEAEYEGGLRSALLEGETEIIGDDKQIVVQWSAPAGGIVPKYYNVYGADTGETTPTAYRWIQVPGGTLSAVLSEDLTDAVVYPGDPGDAYSLVDVEADTEVDSEDYTFDPTKGLIQSVDLTSNKLYRFTYNYTKPATATFEEGALNAEPVYRKLLIMQNTALDSQEKLKAFRLEKVNIRSQGASEAIQTAGFEDGISVTFDCDYDLVTQRVGQKIVNGSIVENWDNAGF